MEIKDFINQLAVHKIEFFCGVPDSLLKELCDYLYINNALNENHFVTADEGGAIALSAGYHLATGKVGCVYMQNSGIGNAANPIISLTNPHIYGIPSLLIVGWRGEPFTKDEPQHIFQGLITESMLNNMGIETIIFDANTTIEKLEQSLVYFESLFLEGKSAAFVVKKGSFTTSAKGVYQNNYLLNRERAIEIITRNLDESHMIVSTTGKASRELFEIREKYQEGHMKDFLTVGSMGHSSMIALGIAKFTSKKIVCIEGDGAILMHTGALSIIGNSNVNMLHYLLNNQAHETVGGMPTATKKTDFAKIAAAMGYDEIYQIYDEKELEAITKKVKNKNGKIFIEVFVGLGARENLGRPTTSTHHNKLEFMKKVSD